ncbi:MAG: hypothetical protein P8O79_02070 [Halieaceae bacterium]|nr:hypothetical protein [Halieaceae bacterium]
MNLIVKVIVILFVASGASWIAVTGWFSYGCRDAFSSNWFTQIVAKDVWTKLDSTTACVLDEVTAVDGETIATYYLSIPALIVLVGVAMNIASGLTRK